VFESTPSRQVGIGSREAVHGLSDKLVSVQETLCTAFPMACVVEPKVHLTCPGTGMNMTTFVVCRAMFVKSLVCEPHYFSLNNHVTNNVVRKGIDFFANWPPW
jgi:hypothetical protein